MMLNILQKGLFHKACPICKCAIKQSEELCFDCGKLFSGCISNHFTGLCPQCGKPFHSCICHKNTPLQKVVFPFFYTGSAIQLAYQVKEEPDAFMVLDFVTEHMVKELCRKKTSSFDGVTYIPTTGAKLNARGFNPSQRLAEIVAIKMSLPLISPPIKRNEDGANQHSLSAIERKENVDTLYSATGERISGHLLLVDDIVTTGSTLERCSTLLLSAGAVGVTAVCGFGTLIHH